MVPKGIILDCLCVLLGTNWGSAIKNHIPARINQPMNVIFGLSAIAIGITSVVKLHSLPAVILAFILGGLIGEAVNLDDKIKSLFQRILERLRFQIHGDKEVYMRFYLIISGDFTILLSKAVMDIFAATLFATTLGRAMNLIVLPQFLILCACFYGARFILPLTTEAMLQDFVAVGGLLTLVLGLSIAQIKHISAVNLLPALVLIWPSSWLFGQWIG